MAAEGDALVAGGISQTPSYRSGLGKQKIQAEFQKQVGVFVEHKVDFLMAEVRDVPGSGWVFLGYFSEYQNNYWPIRTSRSCDN